MYSRYVLGVLVLFLAVNFAVTDRSWKLASLPRVQEIETLPTGPEMAGFLEATQASAEELAYPPHAAPPEASSGVPPLKVGIAYREVSLFGMPLWAYPEPGLVTYVERPAHMRVLVLSPEQQSALDQAGGKAYSRVRFPWYFHLWGWLLLVGVIAWTKARSIDTRRAEERELQRETAASEARSA